MVHMEKKLLKYFLFTKGTGSGGIFLIIDAGVCEAPRGLWKASSL